MAGKRGLVMGVANDHSIAWGIALIGEGDFRALTRQHPRDPPGDGMVVGHTHHQSALAGHQSRF